MDTSKFATLLSPNSLGLMNVIAANLLRGQKSADDIEARLYKLNVYGPGMFFKPHVDTPRGDDMFGTLVLVLPTIHEGGALAFRHAGQEWKFDSAKALMQADHQAGPTLAYVAFMGDMTHEVLPVISGYRVTLTYNLHYRKAATHVEPFSVSDFPGLDEMRQSLSTTTPTFCQTELRGADSLVRDLCKELNIDVAVKALYRNDDALDFCLSDGFIWGYNMNMDDPVMGQMVRRCGARYCRDIEVMDTWYENEDEEFSTMVWVKPLSKSNPLEESHAVYGNESSWGTLYGEICLVAEISASAKRQCLKKDDSETNPMDQKSTRED